MNLRLVHNTVNSPRVYFRRFFCTSGGFFFFSNAQPYPFKSVTTVECGGQFHYEAYSAELWVQLNSLKATHCVHADSLMSIQVLPSTTIV